MPQLAERLVRHLQRPGAVPLTSDELARDLRLAAEPRARLAATLDSLVQAGRLALIKRDRYCVPDEAGLITGRIAFRVSGSASLTAEDGDPAPIFIAEEDTGTALHGDRVIARLTDEARVFAGKRERAARVVRVLERARTTVVGTLRRGSVSHHVVPDDPRFTRDVIVPDPARGTLQPPPQPGDRVVVSLLPWEQRHLNPEGEIIERLGRGDDPRVDLRAVLKSYGIDAPFPGPVLEACAALPTRVPPADTRGRLDLRDELVFTIDPDDARDFDDALSLQPGPRGTFTVGVHIADVGAYVPAGTPLDREARRRCNSTYLVGHVVPMLPEPLSNGLCSLVEAEDRLTFSCLMTCRADGRVMDARFERSVIRSAKRLTYAQAYALLTEDDLAAARRVAPPAGHRTGSTGKPLSEVPDELLVRLRDTVRQLWAIGERRRAARMRNGSLDLDMPEMKILTGPDGRAERLVKIEHDSSHQLVEEWMLAANEQAARLLRHHKVPALYRVHADPDPAKLQDYAAFVASHGIETGDLTQRPNVTRLLERLREHPQGQLLRTQMLRSLRKAVYLPKPEGHYGLCLRDYTHFTSPIRRYADLVVHRALAAHLAQDIRRLPAAGELEELATHLTHGEINSTEAERDHVKRMLVGFFQAELERRARTEFEALITDVRNHGLMIELTEAGILGMIHLSTLRDDFYVVTGDGLTGRRTGKRYRIGDRLQVVIARVDAYKKQFDFEPVAPRAAAKPPPPRGRQHDPRTAQPAPAQRAPQGQGDRRKDRHGAHAVPAQRPPQGPGNRQQGRRGAPSAPAQRPQQAQGNRQKDARGASTARTSPAPGATTPPRGQHGRRPPQAAAPSSPPVQPTPPRPAREPHPQRPAPAPGTQPRTSAMPRAPHVPTPPRAAPAPVPQQPATGAARPPARPAQRQRRGGLRQNPA